MPISDFSPVLFDPHTPDAEAVTIANGESFELAQLYELLDCQAVEVVGLSRGLILITDEEGSFAEPTFVNAQATALLLQHVPQARHLEPINGRAILCHRDQFR